MTAARRVVRVLLVDDERLVCAHLRTIFGYADDIEVVDEAYDGAEAIDSVTRHRPDVVLMDLRMPGVDGITAISRITALPDPPAVVALTTFDADRFVLKALRAGAAGFLLKSTPPEDLIGLVRVAADGHSVLSAQATRRLIDSAAGRRTLRNERLTLVETLTPREVDVLKALGDGLSNAGIARKLYLSETTVKGHVSRILVKLGCDNRAQAGLLAREADLLD